MWMVHVRCLLTKNNNKKKKRIAQTRQSYHTEQWRQRQQDIYAHVYISVACMSCTHTLKTRFSDL